MDIESLNNKGICIIRIREKVVADSEIDEILKTVQIELKAGCKKIVLSFLPSSYPYSPVLSALTRSHRLAMEYGVKVAVVAPKQEFIDVILETHLDRMFDIFRSENECFKDSAE